MIVQKLKKWKAATAMGGGGGGGEREMKVGVIQEQENDELGTRLRYGYEKLMLLVQLCVLFPTGFCNMGVAAANHRIKTVCYC